MTERSDREETMDNERMVRLRILLDEWFVLVMVLLAVLLLMGGWLVYTAHLSPDERTDERTVTSWSETADFEHTATVQNETQAFSEGETLSDRSTYFTSVTPELDGELIYGYTASSGELDTTVSLELVIRSVDDEGVEYWAVNDDLDTENETLGPGDEITVPFSLDVATLENQIEELEEEHGSSPGSSELAVVSHVNTTGVVNDEVITDEKSVTLETVFDSDTYTVETIEDGEWTYERTESGPQTTAAADPLRSFGSVILLLVGVGGLVVLGGAKHRNILTPPEAKSVRLAVTREREEFDDWISTGTLPKALLDRPRISVESLEDLVDVAIDSDRRVIEDRDRNVFFVTDGDVLFQYDPQLQLTSEDDQN